MTWRQAQFLLINYYYWVFIPPSERNFLKFIDGRLFSKQQFMFMDWEIIFFKYQIGVAQRLCSYRVICSASKVCVHSFPHCFTVLKAQQLRRYWRDIPTPCSLEERANQFQCLALKTISSLKETISSRIDGDEVGSLSCGSCGSCVYVW